MPDAHQIVIARRLARNPCVTIDFRAKDGKRTPSESSELVQLLSQVPQLISKIIVESFEACLSP